MRQVVDEPITCLESFSDGNFFMGNQIHLGIDFHDGGQFGDECTFFAGPEMTVLPLKAVSTARVCVSTDVGLLIVIAWLTVSFRMAWERLSCNARRWTFTTATGQVVPRA